MGMRKSLKLGDRVRFVGWLPPSLRIDSLGHNLEGLGSGPENRSGSVVEIGWRRKRVRVAWTAERWGWYDVDRLERIP
jgi:hypothetical protein